MTYIAWLRIRRRLVVFLGIVLALVALNTLTTVFGHVYRNQSGMSIGWSSERPIAMTGLEAVRAAIAKYHPDAPLSIAFAIAATSTLFFATFATGSLNGMRESLHLAFARPISRERSALDFFLVDVGGLALCFTAIVAIVFVLSAIFGLLPHSYVDGAAWPTLVLGFGVAFMYYGILQGATAWQRRGAGALVGGLWVAFFVAALITRASPFGPIFDGIVVAVRFVDPLVYLATLVSAIGHDGAWGTDGAALAIVWSIGLLGCAVAALSWKRLEV